MVVDGVKPDTSRIYNDVWDNHNNLTEQILQIVPTIRVSQSLIIGLCN